MLFACGVEAADGRADFAGCDRLELLIERLQSSRRKPLRDVPGLEAEALGLLGSCPDPSLEVQLRIELSWNASRTGDMDAGLEQAQRARELAVELEDAEEVARADYHLAVAHWYRGEPAEALALAERALEAQRELDDWEAVATTLTLLGSAHRSRSDYDKAIACHLEALELAQGADDVAATARSRNNIGLVYWNLGEHAGAYDYLEQVVEAYRDLAEDSNLATALSNLGLVLVEMGDPEGAMPILREALELDERLGRDRALARLLGNIAFAQEKLGRIDEALETLDRAVELRRELGDDWSLARSFGSMGHLYREQGRHDLARESYTRAAAAAERAEAREELADIHYGIAGVEEDLGRYPEALGALRRHVEIVRDLDRTATARRITKLESQALLEAQELLVTQERFARNAAIVGASAFLLLGIFGWNLFLLKRRAHSKLEVLHSRLADYATDLEEARGRIRGLEELLPICSHCKSIRDEAGDWQQLESYLHHRAGAQLTHGICPDCVEEALRA